MKLDISAIIPGLLAAGCWVSLADCIKKKKMYSEENITVLSGRVVSWGKQ